MKIEKTLKDKTELSISFSLDSLYEELGVKMNLDRFLENLEKVDLVNVLSSFDSILKEIRKAATHLTVRVSKNEDKSTASFSDGKLQHYTHLTTSKDNTVVFLSVYKENTGCQFSFSNQDGRVVEYPYCEEVSDFIRGEMRKVDKLKQGRDTTLCYDGRLLCELYQLFYCDSPDFSKKDIHRKTQIMMSTLYLYGVTLGKDYDFSQEYPCSLSLATLVSKLVPFGKIDPSFEADLVTEDDAIVVRQVGSKVREYMADGYIESEIFSKFWDMDQKERGQFVKKRRD